MSKNNVLIYLLRRDLRVSDNPVLHHLATSKDHGFTHFLPVYVFPAHQIEASGFMKYGDKSPYPEAKSLVAGYWRCGPHRAKFIAESVWNLKESLESLGSGLVLRVGLFHDVLESLVDGLRQNHQTVGAVWMTGEESVEERRDERALSSLCKDQSIDFKLWVDEKYLVDDRDLTIQKAGDLPDIFTTYRKQTEPLRDRPRAPVEKPEKQSLPPLPDASHIPAQAAPFTIPDAYEDLEKALLDPIKQFLPHIPPFPENTVSAHPFKGGEDSAHARLQYLITSGTMKRYKDTRNGLIGPDYSTKLSAFLAQGCITARQIHYELAKYENGTDESYEKAAGYGEGENEGTKGVRIELLWRDYMRLCTRRFKQKLFRLYGFRVDEKASKEQETRSRWKSANPEDALPDQSPTAQEVAEILARFNAGTTGMGLIDASQRELIHTGYTSNRARQNSASFLAKQLGIDWRYGAEWYEMMLVDYDVNSNWANWQYVSGVGNDPRGEVRIFNPVKQAFAYDKDGAYVRAWVPEVRGLEQLENVFQVWTTSQGQLWKNGLQHNPMVTNPIKRIHFHPDIKPKSTRRPFNRKRGTFQRPDDSSPESAIPQQPPPDHPIPRPREEGEPDTGEQPSVQSRPQPPAQPPRPHQLEPRAQPYIPPFAQQPQPYIPPFVQQPSWTPQLPDTQTMQPRSFGHEGFRGGFRGGRGSWSRGRGFNQGYRNFGRGQRSRGGGPGQATWVTGAPPPPNRTVSEPGA